MKKAARVQVPVLHSMDSVKESTRETATTTSVNIIQEIMSLSGNALSRAIRHPDNYLFTDVVLETLIEDISSLTGKRLISDCALENGTTKTCKFAEKVSAELSLMVPATERCIEIIDSTLADKNYVYGLTASRELLDAISGSSFYLLLTAPTSCDPDKVAESDPLDLE